MPWSAGYITNMFESEFSPHTGGNVTGVTVFAGMLLGKRLELLHELVPKASIIGILVNPDAADAEPEIGEVRAAAQTLGQRIQVLSTSGDAAIETAFGSRSAN
jgi:putative ABC transport system substrate-binding protein